MCTMAANFCISCIWNEMNVIGISKDFSGSISELLIYRVLFITVLLYVATIRKYAKHSYRAFIAIWNMWPICGSVHAWVVLTG